MDHSAVTSWMTAEDKLIQIALTEEGYCEKKTNAQLDSKTANAGSNNYTKYARDLVKEIGAPYSQGVAWCDMFVDWCMIKAFGKELAKKLLGGWSAYTPTSADFYQRNKRWYTKPKKGDQIFFKNSSRINHTGLVVSVNGDKIETIEGNSGNKVRMKTYKLGDSTIAGFGRPYYGLVPVEEQTVETASHAAVVDGVDITEALNPYVFDAKKYRAAYKDLDAAFGDNWSMYYWHYELAGKAEIASGAREPFM